MQIRYWLMVIGAAGTTACSTLTPPGQSESTVHQAPASVEQTVAPTQSKKAKVVATNIKPDMLFRLLSAEVAGQRGNIELAVAQYAAAARASRDPKVVERATRIAVFARNDKIALEMAKLWVQQQPSNIEAHQVVAAMYIRSGKIADAKDHLQKVIALSEQNPDNGFMLVTSLLGKEKDKQTALHVMEELIVDHQNDPDALYAYSQLAVIVGELQKAKDAIVKVIALRPNMNDAYVLHTNILFRQGKKAEAFAEIQKALDANPDSDALRQFYARRLVDERRYADARKEYEVLLQHSPESYEAMYALGLLALQMHDLDDAEKHFKDLIDKDQLTSESYYYLGQIAETRNKPEQAMRAYNEVGQGQHFFEAQIRMSMLEARGGDIAHARERLHAIPSETTETEVKLLLAEGELLREAKMHQEAFDFYNDALNKIPDNSQLLYARALAAEKIERLDVTLADLEAIVKRDTKNAQALNALGYTLVDRTKRSAEGMAYIQKAYAMQPDDPAILDSLGWANYRLGNHTEALKFLRRAFDKLKDAEIAAHLGEVLWITGDQDGARTVWDSALRETPSHKILLDVIKRFTK